MPTHRSAFDRPSTRDEPSSANTRKFAACGDLHHTADRADNLSLAATIALFAFGLTVCGWAAWQERRQRGLGDLPLLPPIPVLLVGVMLVLLSLAHLVTLWTGVPLKSRFLP